MQTKYESKLGNEPTIAAAEFIQRDADYNEQEDGLNFNGWYHVDDIKRIIWKKFNQLDEAAKQNILQPFVFFDGLDGFTLEKMLSPLITKLKNSPQKYYPFIFKPEHASVHYVSGFLRKGTDHKVSIMLFNPTGTTPRLDFGNFAYTFRLLQTNRDEVVLESDSEPEARVGDSDSISDSELAYGDEDEVIEDNALYFQTENGELQYRVINPEGFQITNSFTQQDLNDLGLVVDLNKPLTNDIILTQLSPKAVELLKITAARGDTEQKIEIISSSHKLQTSEKDGGKLVSCGPLSLAFIEYVLGNPDYMAHLDRAFHLPKFLNIHEDDLEGYRKLVTDLRQKHYEVLCTIDDKDLKSEIIDDSYQIMSNCVLGVEPEPNLTPFPEDTDIKPKEDVTAEDPVLSKLLDNKDLKSAIIDHSYQIMSNCVLGIEPEPNLTPYHEDTDIRPKEDVTTEEPVLSKLGRVIADELPKEESISKPIVRKADNLQPIDNQNKEEALQLAQKYLSHDGEATASTASSYGSYLDKYGLFALGAVVLAGGTLFAYTAYTSQDSPDSDSALSKK